MSDNYQAVYDAVRSRMGNCDVGDAIGAAVREANLSHYVATAASVVSDAAYLALSEQIRPSVLYRPALSIDGNQWSALYGANLQDGVCGFGDSPEKAMVAFDKEWVASLPRIAP